MDKAYPSTDIKEFNINEQPFDVGLTGIIGLVL